ncbi:MAG TPA: PQQ-binding-like beta-propeller repeat protein [Planctomycetota bacterium]|nr:PQQ-binding-like beta-propeller repeat protein [Planctomycetota bacterium]
MRQTTLRSLLGVLALAAVAQADPEEWSGWRGPRRDGTSLESGFPLRWSATENVLWKVSIPGKGHSSPVVWGDRIFLTTCMEDSGDRKLLCLDRNDGRVLWEQVVVTTPKEHIHKLNSYASSTPVTDGKRVWVAFLDEPKFVIFCYDVDGKLVWKKSPGEFHSVHGFCSSPLLYKDMVIFNGDQDAVAYIVALDKETGAERWRTDRPNRTRSYVPPVIFEAAGRPQMVLSGSKCVASYDPDTGKQIWIIDGPTEQFVASMVYAEGVFFITGGFPQWHVLGIKPDGQGNVTDTHILWRDKGQDICSYVPSPVAWGEHFFIASDAGNATCFEAKTGKRMWSQKLSGTEKLRGHISASPVAAGGYLYFPDDAGVTHVVKAGATFELVAKNELGEACYASPALSRGRIYIRTAKSLFCIAEKAK